MQTFKSFIFKKDSFRLIALIVSSVLIALLIIAKSRAQKASINKLSLTGLVPQKLPDKPNIIWITTEGVPVSVLSCYGSQFIKTPNIDRIANEGMLFTNSFCTNALCAPSRATLLTGKYSHLNGMLSNPGETTGQ